MFAQDHWFAPDTFPILKGYLQTDIEPRPKSVIEVTYLLLLHVQAKHNSIMQSRSSIQTARLAIPLEQ